MTVYPIISTVVKMSYKLLVSAGGNRYDKCKKRELIGLEQGGSSERQFVYRADVVARRISYRWKFDGFSDSLRSLGDFEVV